MHVFSNLATSLDGKIAPANRTYFLLGTPADRRQMQILRRRADAVLFGASTLRAYRAPCLVRGAARQPVNIVVSSALEGISPSWPFFRSPNIRRILFVTGQIPLARLRKFSATSEVVQLKAASARHPVAPQVIRELTRRGIERLLVEGGGSIMWDFASQGLIDEYNVTLTPRILGGTEAPTLVDGLGFTPEKSLRLKLVSARVVGDEIFLIYRKTPSRSRKP